MFILAAGIIVALTAIYIVVRLMEDPGMAVVIAILIGILLLLLTFTAQGHEIRIVVPRQAALYRATVIREVRFYWGMAERPSTFLGQIHQESAFKEDAKSSVGATGLAQMMPTTAAWLNQIYPSDLKKICPQKSGCPLSPAWAIKSLVLFDKRLYDDFRWANGAMERWSVTLSGYNGGRSWVLRERRACAGTVGCNDTLWFGNIELICLRSAASCKENRNYPRRILLELRHHYE